MKMEKQGIRCFNCCLKFLKINELRIHLIKCNLERPFRSKNLRSAHTDSANFYTDF